jgi:hypothetical protein
MSTIFNKDNWVTATISQLWPYWAQRKPEPDSFLLMVKMNGESAEPFASDSTPMAKKISLLLTIISH